jgi:hypothetical protein
MADCACYIGVKKKVANVMSALDGWSNMVFDRVMFPAMVRCPIAPYFHNACRLFLRLKYIIRNLCKYNKCIFTFQIIILHFYKTIVMQTHNQANKMLLNMKSKNYMSPAIWLHNSPI